MKAKAREEYTEDDRIAATKAFYKLLFEHQLGSAATPACQKCGSPIVLSQMSESVMVKCSCTSNYLEFPPDKRWGKGS